MSPKTEPGDANGIVYSSELGRMCPSCGHPANQCRCAGSDHFVPGDGRVRVQRETKGRGGKAVSVITGLPLDKESATHLLQDLKRLCGTGGTIKGSQIEIQGDHRDRLIAELVKRGFSAKKKGG